MTSYLVFHGREGDMKTKRPQPKLEEARRRWGCKAVVLTGEAEPKRPRPTSPAAALAIRKAA